MAFSTTVKEQLNHLYRLGQSPEDNEEIRLWKSTLVVGSMITAVVGIVWGIVYIFMGATLPGLIPLGYTFISMAAFLYYCWTKRYRVLRTVQLVLILFLPFFLMAALGGFVPSGLVNIWAFICPMGALFFLERKAASRWLIAYLALLVIGGLAQPYLAQTSIMSPTLIQFFIVVNIAVVSTLTFILLSYFIGQKNLALGLLRKERERSESLLLNVLPPEVAERLKLGERTIADHYDSASVLFADLVGFTPLSRELPPIEMVELLNEIYSFFDSLVEKYNVEKIRTIGDNYMVAAGLPTPRSDHAEALARMALEMITFLESRQPLQGRRLTFRIGINSGPVIAGVIGHRKFTYDVWGDTVNIASRMESQGSPGKIQITANTYALIKDHFNCVNNGTKEIKGGGLMETWFLMGVTTADEVVEPAKQKAIK